jgi:hypothetical protein
VDGRAFHEKQPSGTSLVSVYATRIHEIDSPGRSAGAQVSATGGIPSAAKSRGRRFSRLRDLLVMSSVGAPAALGAEDHRRDAEVFDRIIACGTRTLRGVQIDHRTG